MYRLAHPLPLDAGLPKNCQSHARGWQIGRFPPGGPLRPHQNGGAPTPSWGNPGLLCKALRLLSAAWLWIGMREAAGGLLVGYRRLTATGGYASAPSSDGSMPTNSLTLRPTWMTRGD